jgi:hypothetical protein
MTSQMFTYDYTQVYIHVCTHDYTHVYTASRKNSKSHPNNRQMPKTARAKARTDSKAAKGTITKVTGDDNCLAVYRECQSYASFNVVN